MTLTIRTNNVPRDIIYYNDLTKFEQQEVIDNYGTSGCNSWSGFRFKGFLYNLDDFTTTAYTSGDLKDWQAVYCESAFSGVLIKLVDNGERVVVGMYFT